MRKHELIAKISNETGIVKKDTQKIINGFFLIIKRALFLGNSVTLNKFGTFEIRKRKHTKRYDINTGKVKNFKAYCYPHLRFSKQFKTKTSYHETK